MGRKAHHLVCHRVISFAVLYLGHATVNSYGNTPSNNDGAFPFLLSQNKKTMAILCSISMDIPSSDCLDTIYTWQLWYIWSYVLDKAV